MKKTGYMRLDHRATQGIAYANGVPILSGEDGTLEETDTSLCCHCHAVLKRTGTPGEVGYCNQCHDYYCPTANCVVCLPWVAQIQEAMDREYHRDQFAKVVGLER